MPADDGTDIVGSAVFFVGEDATTCEFAITVQSTFSGVGLATTLLTALIDAARKRGLKTMEGFVLSKHSDAAPRQARRFQFGPILTTALRVCRLDLTAPSAYSLRSRSSGNSGQNVTPIEATTTWSLDPGLNQ